MRYENNEMNQKIPKDLSPKELHKWLEKDVLQPIIIDVREEEELEMAKFPSTTFNLPLSKFQITIIVIAKSNSPPHHWYLQNSTNHF